MKWKANNNDTWVGYTSVKFVISHLGTFIIHMEIGIIADDMKSLKVFSI